MAASFLFRKKEPSKRKESRNVERFYLLRCLLSIYAGCFARNGVLSLSELPLLVVCSLFDRWRLARSLRSIF